MTDIIGVMRTPLGRISSERIVGEEGYFSPHETFCTKVLVPHSVYCFHFTYISDDRVFCFCISETKRGEEVTEKNRTLPKLMKKCFCFRVLERYKVHFNPNKHLYYLEDEGKSIIQYDSRLNQLKSDITHHK